MTPPSRRLRAATTGFALLAITFAAPTLAQRPAVAGTAHAPGPAAPVLHSIDDAVAGLSEIDQAGPAVLPTPTQTGAANGLGSGVSVTWNDAGTPASIFARDGKLAPATGQSPAAEALSWISAHRDVLGLTAAQVGDLQLVSDQKFADSAARAVLYRQTFDGLVPATRGMVTVGVAADGSIAYVSSSLVKGTGVVPPAVLSPLQGWLKAAANVGRTVSGADLTKIASTVSAGWTRLTVPGFDQTQLARTRVFVKNDGTIRPVVESDVVDTSMGTSTAYRVMVDAVDGSVLLRHDAVENSTNAYPFQGTYGPGAICSQRQTFDTTDGLTKTIAVFAAAAVAADDIVIKLYGPGNALLGTYDLATSPETATYTAPNGGTLAQGTYGFEVCGLDATAIGGPFVATAATSDAGGSVGDLPAPKWRAFAANPDLASVTSTTGAPANSVVECWTAGTPGCSPGESHQNIAAFGPWDQVNAVPTFTTIGNNANTHEAWANPLAPGGTAQAPYSPTRDYTTPFTDVWNNTKCDPTNLVPGGNDINAVVTNLFTGHNRIHDFAYYLGFTEANYNLQLDNGGRGGQGGDQELGNVQAGAIDGGNPTFEGRDNANQIALQDGVPGITNQYLFQPIAGSFYSPCADGAMDTGIYGHEYTHAISNRMVGGPDDGLTSQQGGAMGESWSDLDASEYEFENDYSTGTPNSPWALGAYTTGNFAKGIRDYAINDNPLNYSDYGFDTTGPEVHADGEIWNGTQWEVRQALVNKWNASFPYTDKALQKRCSQATPTESPLNASACPGNRRWLQLIYDAWLLQPGATDMLQARDAMLAADQMRFGGANQAALASAFARRGMGADASTPDPDSEDVTPSFRSAYGNNPAVTFTSTRPGKVYVGDYEARATPIADTDPSTPLTATAQFTPGIYTITFASPASGFRRLTLTVPDNGSAISVPVDDAAANVASAANGAAIIPGATTAGALNAGSLIDGTEGTNWAGVTATNVDQSHPGVAVSLAGGLQTISSAKVSALLRPAPGSATDLPLLVGQADDPDPDSGSRFTALRQFELQACTTGCTDPANYTTFYTSPADAFPGDIPRPVAPDQTMRTFRFDPVQASAVRLVALQNQCTGQAKYSGEQDNDPTNATDCATASDRGTIVHAAELQLFSGAIPSDPATGTPGTGAPCSGTPGEGTSALPSSQCVSPPPPAASVKKVRTHTRIRLPRIWQVKGQESTKLKYQVVGKTTSNGAKAGVAVIKLDGKKVKKVKVAVTRKHGKKVVGYSFRIPRDLGFGKHVLQVKFKSANKSLFTSSKSRRVTLTVVRSRPGPG